MIGYHHTPELPRQQQTRRHQRTLIEVYHGTSAHFAEPILTDGLRSFRSDGGIHYTPCRDRALCYAQAWAIGLHAIGLATDPEGVILGISFPRGTPAHPLQLNEYWVENEVPPSRVRILERHDFSGLGEVERAGHLFQFAAIVGYRLDAYKEDRFRTMHDTAMRLVKQLPGDLLAAGLNAVKLL
jgi:hypothetical protein